jgi:hypothetical protein
MNGTAAVLFTIVTGVCCSQIAGTAKVPAGFPLDIAISPEWCGDGRYIEAKATGNHTASINGGRKVSIPDSVSQVRHLLRTRANSIVFVSGAAYPTVISLNSRRLHGNTFASILMPIPRKNVRRLH